MFGKAISLGLSISEGPEAVLVAPSAHRQSCAAPLLTTLLEQSH